MYRGNVAHVDDVVRQELKCHVSRVKELKNEAHDCKSAQTSAIKLRVWRHFSLFIAILGKVVPSERGMIHS